MRGTGRTTDQIKNAPYGAVFVCCNHRAIKYTSSLANALGRSDIKIVSPSWLAGNGWRGDRRVVVVDHAAELTPDEQYGLEGATARIRPQ